MQFGVHLPLLATAGPSMPVARVLDYVDHAEALGYEILAAHDHVAHPRPWLDGPTMLAAVLPRLRHMVPMTAVVLPVVRGPMALARGLTALDLLSGGRLIAGVGAGSSEADYLAAAIPYAQRWERFDESLSFLRAVWSEADEPFKGRFYSSDGAVLDPGPAQKGGPRLWIGAWGSDAGLRRTARSGDGWIASAYNTTPERFGDAWSRLGSHLVRVGRDPTQFPNALATMALYVSEDRPTADRLIDDVLAPILHRAPEELRQSILIGPAEACVDVLRAYRDAGVQRVLLMPVMDEFRQIELFRKCVVPLVE